VGQGSALSPILSAIYLAPIIKTFKKRIKNLKENIPTDILFLLTMCQGQKGRGQRNRVIDRKYSGME